MKAPTAVRRRHVLRKGARITGLPIEIRSCTPRRHRLRRQVDLGADGGIPSEQPRDPLPRRSSDDEGNRSAPLRRPHRRAGLQHREQDAARRELGFALVLSLDVRWRRQGQQRQHAARGSARTQPLELHRLPGLQVPRPPGGVVLGAQHVPAEEGRSALRARWFRDRRPHVPPGDLSGAGGAVDRGRPADDVQPVLDRADEQRAAAYFMPEDEKSTLYIYEAEVK